MQQTVSEAENNVAKLLSEKNALMVQLEEEKRKCEDLLFRFEEESVNKDDIQVRVLVSIEYDYCRYMILSDTLNALSIKCSGYPVSISPCYHLLLHINSIIMIMIYIHICIIQRMSLKNIVKFIMNLESRFFI